MPLSLSASWFFLRKVMWRECMYSHVCLAHNSRSDCNDKIAHQLPIQRRIPNYYCRCLAILVDGATISDTMHIPPAKRQCRVSIRVVVCFSVSSFYGLTFSRINRVITSFNFSSENRRQSPRLVQMSNSSSGISNKTLSFSSSIIWK